MYKGTHVPLTNKQTNKCFAHVKISFHFIQTPTEIRAQANEGVFPFREYPTLQPSA